MKKNLKNKVALIIAVMLVCLYGIFGIPSGMSGKALLEAISSRIHLGLDLRGGAHLILQVQVADAVKAETDNSVQEIEQDLKKANLTYSQVYKPDPKKPDVIRIEGISPVQSSAVNSILSGDKYSNEYDLAGGGTDSTMALSMKPVFERDLDSRTVQEAIETITDRVDALGVSEPQIAPYGLGANQILVELPGMSNLDQVKALIQETARLEIHAVVGGPYQDETAALASVGGGLPADQEVLPATGSMAGARRWPGLLCSAENRNRGRQRLPFCHAGDQRQYRPARSELHADRRSRRQVLELYQRQRGQEHGGCDGWDGPRSGHHPERDSRLRRNHRQFLSG